MQSHTRRALAVRVQRGSNTRVQRHFKITVKHHDGSVIDTVEFSGPEEFIVEVLVEVPALPERSPLHKDALNMSDLKVGMNISRHHIHTHGNGYTQVGLVNGEPFQMGTKGHRSPWMLPVVTTNYAGKLIYDDWYLSDMGVVPYENANGTMWWNDQNYTLAVS